MADLLSGVRYAVLAVADNGWHSPEVIELSVVHVDDGAITRGPLTWTVRPERMPSPSRAERAYVPMARIEAAPPWREVVEQIAEALAGRMIAAYDVPGDMRVLSRRLPDLDAAGLLDVLALARLAWSHLDRWTLPALLVQAGRVLLPMAGQVFRDSAPPSLANDAHATALVLLGLAHTPNASVHLPNPRVVGCWRS